MHHLPERRNSVELHAWPHLSLSTSGHARLHALLMLAGIVDQVSPGCGRTSKPIDRILHLRRSIQYTLGLVPLLVLFVRGTAEVAATARRRVAPVQSTTGPNEPASVEGLVALCLANGRGGLSRPIIAPVPLNNILGAPALAISPNACTRWQARSGFGTRSSMWAAGAVVIAPCGT